MGAPGVMTESPLEVTGSRSPDDVAVISVIVPVVERAGDVAAWDELYAR